MQLCILKVCIIYCIQFTLNAHRYRISFSSYSCFNLSTIICVAVHVIRMLHTLLQPTLPPLQSSICSKAICSSNSMSIYLRDCFFELVSLLPSRFLCQRHTFGQKWTCLYSIDSAAESTTQSISRTLLLTLIF
jgi:hypothetical protein